MELLLGHIITAFSIVARSQGEAYLSMGLAALALHDGIGFMLDERRAGYALTSLAKAALRVREQNAASFAGVSELAYVLMERCFGPDRTEELLGKWKRQAPTLQEVRKMKLRGDLP